MDEQAVTE